MIPLDLTVVQKQALDTALASSHSIDVTVTIMNLNGDRLSEVGDRLISGQVDYDSTADITRSCTLSLNDPNRTLHFDGDSPSDGALYLDRMIRVSYGVRVNSAGVNWVHIPIFTGPIAKVDRTDDVVNVEAQGKEALAMGASWRPATYKKGAKKVYVIEDVMRDRAGEDRFSLPDLPGRIPKDLSIGRQTSPWEVAQSIARSMDRQLFYDGRGTLRLRKPPENSLFRFRDGTGGTILNSPQISFSTEGLVNVVWVKGGTPRGQKVAISEYVMAPRAHPLSPQRLGRNGVPRYLLEVVEQQSIRSRGEAREVARGRLNRALVETVDVTFDALPIPYLEPLDMARVTTDEFEQAFRLKQFSIPLAVGETMPVGYSRRVHVKGRRNRKR